MGFVCSDRGLVGPLVGEEERGHDQVCVHHRRGGLFAGQGYHSGLPGRDAQAPGFSGVHHEAGPLHQRGRGDHESLPARRGLRHRRWGGDRLGFGALRAFHRRVSLFGQQRHHGEHLLLGHRQGTPGALLGGHGPGDSPRDHGDPGANPQGGRRERRPHRRDRRHGGGHRGIALSRSHSTVSHPGGAGKCVVLPRDPRALHRRGGRDEDQAHPAQCERTSENRHPAGHHRLPIPVRLGRKHQRQDRPLLQRGQGSRGGGSGRPVHIPGPPEPL